MDGHPSMQLRPGAPGGVLELPKFGSVRFGFERPANRNLPGSLSGRQIVKISNICGQKWKNTEYFCPGPCTRALRSLPTKWRSREIMGIDGCKVADLDDVQVISIICD